MKQLIDGIVSFVKFAHIAFNHNKCKMIAYDPTDQLTVDFMLTNAVDDLVNIKRRCLDDALRYFGVHLSIRKLAKVKFNNDRLMKVRMILEILAGRGLNVAQVINVIKTFVLPRLDFSMMNNVMSKVQLKRIDDEVRTVINKLMMHSFSNDFFYAF
jgi:hypothetical protein